MTKFKKGDRVQIVRGFERLHHYRRFKNIVLTVVSLTEYNNKPVLNLYCPLTGSEPQAYVDDCEFHEGTKLHKLRAELLKEVDNGS